MQTLPSKRSHKRRGSAKVVDISTRFKSGARHVCTKPTVGRSIFNRIIEHDSTCQREANHLGYSEAEVYEIFRLETRDRLSEARRLGFIEGRRSAMTTTVRRPAA
jgi:hypothetical protein